MTCSSTWCLLIACQGLQIWPLACLTAALTADNPPAQIANHCACLCWLLRQPSMALLQDHAARTQALSDQLAVLEAWYAFCAGKLRVFKVRFAAVLAAARQ